MRLTPKEGGKGDSERGKRGCSIFLRTNDRDRFERCDLSQPYLLDYTLCHPFRVSRVARDVSGRARRAGSSFDEGGHPHATAQRRARKHAPLEYSFDTLMRERYYIPKGQT